METLTQMQWQDTDLDPTIELNLSNVVESYDTWPGPGAKLLCSAEEPNTLIQPYLENFATNFSSPVDYVSIASVTTAEGDAATDGFPTNPSQFRTFSSSHGCRQKASDLLQSHFDPSQAQAESSYPFASDAESLSPVSPRDTLPSSSTNVGRRSQTNGSFSSDSKMNIKLESPASPSRRRKSLSGTPDSARAVYLERNRKAASKCRSKQKKQQENLVETARHVERKHKLLKAEVDLLKQDVRVLLDAVGEHKGCSDTRLHIYVQRKADQLAEALNTTTNSDLSRKTSKPELQFSQSSQ